MTATFVAPSHQRTTVVEYGVVHGRVGAMDAQARIFHTAPVVTGVGSGIHRSQDRPVGSFSRYSAGRGLVPTTESRNYVEREHFKKRDIPNPLDILRTEAEVGVAFHYSFGAVFCAVGNLMIDAYLVAPRELALHEAHEIVASCILPIFGRAIVHRIFFDHPEWDDLPMGPKYTYDFQQGIR